jgi:hypothetical protein
MGVTLPLSAICGSFQMPATRTDSCESAGTAGVSLQASGLTYPACNRRTTQDREQKVKIGIFAAAVAIAASSGVLQAQAVQGGAGNTDVPVRTVMLFSSGVGYFEHAGTVRGNSTTELSFRTAQINDILKSLVLHDLDGGRVSNVTYPSQDPIARTLRSFKVDIAENPGLASLLNQLRGSRITLRAQGENITGIILGVENRRLPVERGEPAAVPVLNILSGPTIKSVELATVVGLTLDDPQLQEELTLALAAVSQSRDQDRKPVQINFSGSGDRRVRVGYVVETPVWKTSYRLLLDDEGGHMQGWAIVENQTESDWSNVSLSLVSGRPISFVMDLYQPLYATRQVVRQQMLAGLRPQMYDAGTGSDVSRDRMEADYSARGVAGGTASGVVGGTGTAAADMPYAAFTVGKAEASALTLTATVQAAGTAASMGELFEYNVGNVNLPRRQSAMIPIVADSVRAERVSLYNASVLARHPLNGVLFRNITGKHFLQGPVTVMDGDGYAGDARIDNVPPGQERLLSYGVDLDILVDSRSNNSAAQVTVGSIVKGVLMVERKFVSTVEYAADNKGTRDRTLVIEHPLRAGWKLISPEKPYESTPALHRFKGTAAAGKVTVVAVREERVISESVRIISSDIAQILSYTTSGEISAPVRAAIVRVADMRRALTETERLVNERFQQITTITQEQARIRENMSTVTAGSQYYERLLTKLNEQETEIEKLQQERADFSTRAEAQRAELEAFVANLNVG